MKHRLFVPLALVFAAQAASASVVDRQEVTLGRLTDNSDCVLVAIVKKGGPRLELERAHVLKGRAPARLALDSAPYLRWRVGQRALIFLRRGRREGSFRRLVTEYQRVVLSSPQSERALVEATRSRIARLNAPSDQLPRDLFAQLRSPEPRVREDAGWDLLAQKNFQPQAAHLLELSKALKEAPSVPVLRLCARWPQERNLAPLLTTSLSANADLREEAVAALERTRPGRAIELLRLKLLGAEARSAVRSAATFKDLEARKLVLEAFDHPKEEVRLEALSRLSEGSPSPGEVAALASVVWSPKSQESQRIATAGLALASAGLELRKIADLHPDPELRRLASRLRRDPVRVARNLLR